MELVEPPCQAAYHAGAPRRSSQRSADELALPALQPPSAVNPWTSAALAGLAFLLVLWNALLVYGLLLGLPQDDFCRMYYSARAYWHNEDMYGWNAATPAKLNEEVTIDLWNMNPPHFHLILLPLGALPRDAALAGWLALNLACLVIALRWIVLEIGLELTPRVRQWGLIALLAFSGTNCQIVTSQLALVLLVPLTAAWMYARRGRWTAAGFILGVVISVKPFLLLLVPYLLLRRRWKAVAACGAGGAVCFALGLLVFGVESHLSWQRCLGIADTWAWLPMNASLLGMLSRTFSPTVYFIPTATWTPATIQGAFFVLGALMALATVIVAARDQRPGEVDRNFALLLIASVMLCPLGWVYYFWLPLGPTMAVIHDWKREAETSPSRRRVGRVVFWIGFAGLFWPIQLNLLGQGSAWATMLFASLYFWTIFGLWLGLLLEGWSASSRRIAWRLAC